MTSWNDSVIEEFRAGNGAVGGPFQGKRLILLHTVGRRSGKEYVTPLVAASDGDDIVVCGSLGGAPTDPQWIGNLEAGAGTTTIEIDTGTTPAAYTVVRPGDADWERLYGIWRTYWPAAADYETKTDRQFPVVRLHVAD